MYFVLAWLSFPPLCEFITGQAWLDSRLKVLKQQDVLTAAWSAWRGDGSDAARARHPRHDLFGTDIFTIHKGVVRRRFTMLTY